MMDHTWFFKPIFQWKTCLNATECHLEHSIATPFLLLLIGVSVLVIWKIQNKFDWFGGSGGKRAKPPKAYL